MDEQTRKALELAREAIRDGLSVCQSVSMGRSRRVMRDDCVFYLQTEEWCKWVEDEIGALMGPALAAIDAALSAPAAPVVQPVSEPSDALGYATRLAVSLHASLYPDVVQWKPLPDLLGVLTQIDNMVCGIALRPAVKTQPLADEQIDAARKQQ